MESGSTLRADPLHLAGAITVAVLAVALAACARGQSVGEHLVATHRLADERVAALHQVGAGTIGIVTRPALTGPIWEKVYPRGDDSPVLKVPADGTLALAVHCPAALAGYHVALAIAVANTGKSEAARCPEESGASVPVRIERLPPREEVRPVVILQGLVTAPVKTRRLRVGPGATLRVALGIESGLGGWGTPVRFRVLALRRGRPATTVLDRTLEGVSSAEGQGWSEVAVPLAASVGSGDFRLAFVAQPLRQSDWPILAVWGDPTIAEPAPRRASPRPNVILISLDTLRADRLGCYGAQRPTSPTLDRLAAEGTLFETTITAAPWTLPSHLTMLSGVYACVHERVSRDIGQRLTPGIQPLAQRLRVEGYDTAAFTEDGFLLTAVFQPGFGIFTHAGAGEKTVEQTLGDARRWLAERERQPFFLFLHTYQVHWPYVSPKPYQGMFAGGTRPPLNQQLDDYDASLRYLDDTLGAFFAGLKELGLADHTIVIVTSDHGEGFNEHGTLQHGNSLYEELLRVPFIWHAPGLIAAGRRVSTPVGLIDVVPTVLDLVGLPVPDTLQGRSLVSLVRLDAPLPPPDRTRILFSENSYEGYSLVARGDTWKAFFDPDGTRRLYALATDPDERNPESGNAFADAAEAARARFVEQCARLRDGLGTASAPEAPTAPAPGQRERLRALGYVE